MRHGLGVFATKSFDSGAMIGGAVIDGELMSLSRYMNHSAEPNAAHVWKDGHAFIVAEKDTGPGAEITLNYRRTLLGVKK